MKFWYWVPIKIWHNMESVNNFLLLKITPPYCIGVEKVCVPGGRRGTRWNVLLRKVSCCFPECGGAQGENIIFYWLYCIQYTYSPIPPEQIDIFESWHHQHPDPTGSKGGGAQQGSGWRFLGGFWQIWTCCSCQAVKKKVYSLPQNIALLYYTNKSKNIIRQHITPIITFLRRKTDIVVQS